MTELGKDEAFPDVNLEIGLYSAKDAVDEAPDAAVRKWGEGRTARNHAYKEPPAFRGTTMASSSEASLSTIGWYARWCIRRFRNPLCIFQSVPAAPRISK